MIDDNIHEYNLVNKLNKIGLFFKYLFILIILFILIYSIYIYSFKIDKVTKDGDKNSYKKAVINISFSSEKDLKQSLVYIKDYNQVFYNRTNSKIEASEYTPIYLNDIKDKGSLFSLQNDFQDKLLYERNSFYIFKHHEDETAYKRGNAFTPKLEELYSGKVVFESFFKASYIDFINLIAGIMFSDDLYKYKYSEQIKKIVFSTIKKRKSNMISSYNNKDSSTHKNLLNAFNIYYKGDSLESSLLNGNYYLANELIANARYFNFNLAGNNFEYNINFKEKKFIVFMFKNGELVNKEKKLHLKTKLDSGFYNIVILKEESTLLGSRELFWVYLNFNI
jgi:hypothetical protein